MLLARVPEAARAEWMKRADVCASLGFRLRRGASCSRRLPSGWTARCTPARATARCVPPNSSPTTRCGSPPGVGRRCARAVATRRGAAGATRQSWPSPRSSTRSTCSTHQRARHHRRAAAAAGQAAVSAGLGAVGPAARRGAAQHGAVLPRGARAKGGDDVYAFNNWAVACLLLRRLDPSAPAGNVAAGAGRDDRAPRGVDARASWRNHRRCGWPPGSGDLQIVRACCWRPTIRRPTPRGAGPFAAAELYAAAFARGASPRGGFDPGAPGLPRRALTGAGEARWPQPVRGARRGAALDVTGEIDHGRPRPSSAPLAQLRIAGLDPRDRIAKYFRLYELTVSETADASASPTRIPTTSGAAQRGAPGAPGARPDPRGLRRLHANSVFPLAGAERSLRANPRAGSRPASTPRAGPATWRSSSSRR